MVKLTVVIFCVVGAWAAIVSSPETIIGIGFGLSLDHGTASAYFPNGSTVDIIKVGGSAEYRAAMRSPTAAADFLPIDEGESRNITPPLVEQKSTCDYFPSWFTCTKPERPFDSMIESLKNATESYLQISLSDVDISFDFVPSPTQNQEIQAALAAASIQPGPRSIMRIPGGIKVASVTGQDGSCDGWGDNVTEDDSEQLILTIDYSWAALTAILVHEECGIYESRRMLHDVHLGAGALNADPDHVSQTMQDALRKLTRLPLKWGNGEGVSFINNVIVTGEASTNPIFKQVLHGVIGPRFADRPLAVQQHKPIVENVSDSATFAVARSSAYISYQMMQPLVLPHDPDGTSSSFVCVIQSE